MAIVQKESEPLVEELAGLLRTLQEQLQNYAPTWYSKDLDTRVRKTLAVTNSLKSSRKPTPALRSKEV